MVLTLPAVRDLLARRAAGGLSPDEEALLARSARVLRRRLQRLQAIAPELADGIELAGALEELAQPPLLSASA